MTRGEERNETGERTRSAPGVPRRLSRRQLSWRRPAMGIVDGSQGGISAGRSRGLIICSLVSGS
jgi:hypothetical protein